VAMFVMYVHTNFHVYTSDGSLVMAGDPNVNIFHFAILFTSIQE
jgi:hypothetical protein